MLGGINNHMRNENTVNNNHNLLGTDAALQNKVKENTSAGERQKKLLGIEECSTCKNRRYQDGSDDPGVSFKSPQNVDPAQAATAVFSHEREHYTREEAKAKGEGKEVLQNSIQIYTDVCPECGKTYVSGGVTRTVTRKKAEQAQFAKDFFENTVGKYKGKEVDVKQ